MKNASSSRIWLIADLHFGHKGILKYRAGFDSLEDMEQHISDNWRKTVSDDDLVYILGDAAFNLAAHERISKLPGRKTLILGNHDDNSIKKIAPFYNKVCLMKSLRRNNIHFVLTHIPVHPTMLSSWHPALEGDGRWDVNIHGHTHDRAISELSFKGGYFNVSCEAIDYTPISLSDVVSRCTAVDSKKLEEVLFKKWELALTGEQWRDDRQADNDFFDRLGQSTRGMRIVLEAIDAAFFDSEVEKKAAELVYSKEVFYPFDKKHWKEDD